MRGKPKYKVGTKVKFIFGDELKTGEIFVVDKYGTFDNPTDVGYDIMVESEKYAIQAYPRKVCGTTILQR